MLILAAYGTVGRLEGINEKTLNLVCAYEDVINNEFTKLLVKNCSKATKVANPYDDSHVCKRMMDELE